MTLEIASDMFAEFAQKPRSILKSCAFLFSYTFPHGMSILYIIRTMTVTTDCGIYKSVSALIEQANDRVVDRLLLCPEVSMLSRLAVPSNNQKLCERG